MAQCKVADSELIEKLRDKQYISYYAISKSIGLVCNTDLIRRCHRMEELYGIPERIPSRSGRPKENKPKKPKTTKKPIAVRESAPKVEPFTGVPNPKPAKTTEKKDTPFRWGEQVRYDGRLHTVVYADDNKIILSKNADLSYKTITIEEYIQNPEKIVRIEEKRQITTTGEAIVLKQNGKEYIKTVEVAETAKDFEPFEPIDYIDPEWGQELTLREKIKKCAAILFREVEK